MGWQDVKLSRDVSAGGWIAGRLYPFNRYAVGSQVPNGYADYVRIPFISTTLCEVLARHTSTPSKCWFGLWHGYGYFDGGGPVAVFAAMRPFARTRIALARVQLRLARPKRISGDTPTLPLPHRNYFLFKGTVTQGAGWQDGPNLWWPEDRAWFVAFEIDLDYALVGGPSELVDEILGAHLGASRTTLEDSLTAAPE